MDNLQETFPSDFTPEQIKRFAQELHDFRKTELYQHYLSHFDSLYELTINQIIEEKLKGPETIYSRESWIGEARTAKLNRDWFEVFHTEINEAMKHIDK